MNLCKCSLCSKIALLVSVFLCGQILNAQPTVDPAEITEQLNAISRDAKDTLKFHATAPQANSAARVALARKIDSLAQANLPPERVAQLFITVNAPFDVVPYPLKAKLTPPLRKKWVKYYLSVLLLQSRSGGDNPGRSMKRSRELNCRFAADQEMLKLVGLDKMPDPKTKARAVFSYPADGDFNFYPDEFPYPPVGYAILNRRPDDPTGKELPLARWVSAHGQTIYTAATIDHKGKVAFSIPTHWFVKGEIYRLDLCWEDDIMQLQPMMAAAKPPAKEDFYAFDHQAWASEWVGLSEPFATMYFRASRYYSAFLKMKDTPGAFDAENFTYTYELNEPMDSSEIMGTGKLPPDLRWMDNVASELHAMIYRPELAYYLSVPRTGKVSVEDVDKLLPFEQAHLMDAEFVRKVPEKTPELFQVSTESPTPVGNGYVLPGLARNQAYATQTAIPPRITRKHFEHPETLKFAPVKFTVRTKAPEIMRENCQSVRKMLEKRVKERAEFFYAMELRHCKREGKTCAQTLADFEKTERENLPPTLKSLLEQPFAVKRGIGSFAFACSIFPPGADHLSGAFSVGQKSQ